MPTRSDKLICYVKTYQTGVTLIEAIVFIVIISVGLVTLLLAFNQSVVNSVDPALRIKALERGQALMDVILTRKFDENTPTGGTPACGTTSGVPCLGIAPDADFDDVGDYHGFVDSDDVDFPTSVAVVNAGSELGLANDLARKITLTVSMPDGNSLTLSSYKVNY